MHRVPRVPRARALVSASAAESIAFFPSAGNLFEGEWKEGKPVVKNGERADQGQWDWLNEAVANVTNLGGDRSRGNYATVSTHDEDEDRRRR